MATATVDVNRRVCTREGHMIDVTRRRLDHTVCGRYVLVVLYEYKP